jgi:hypothetical protein
MKNIIKMSLAFDHPHQEKDNSSILRELITIKDSLVSNLSESQIRMIKDITSKYNESQQNKTEISEILYKSLGTNKENRPGTVGKILSNCILGEMCSIVKENESMYIYDINSKTMSDEITGNISNTAVIRVEGNYKDIPNEELLKLMNTNKNISFFKIEYREDDNIDYSYKLIKNIDEYLNEEKNNTITIIVMILIIIFLIYMFGGGRKKN